MMVILTDLLPPSRKEKFQHTKLSVDLPFYIHREATWTIIPWLERFGLLKGHIGAHLTMRTLIYGANKCHLLLLFASVYKEKRCNSRVKSRYRMLKCREYSYPTSTTLDSNHKNQKRFSAGRCHIFKAVQSRFLKDVLK